MVAVLVEYTTHRDIHNTLSDRHRDELQSGSGISPEVVAQSGAWTATSRADLLALGFKGAQADLAPAMVLPFETLTPGPAPCIIKPDNPRTIDGKKLKYEIAAGARNVLDVPGAVRAAVLDANEPLCFVEGWKKARALASHSVAVIGLSGVWNFSGKTPDGWSSPLEDFRHIPLKGRRVLIVFDSDVSTNLNVRAARERLRDLLSGHGAQVQYVDLPPLPDGSKCGVDDYLLTHTVARDLFGLAYNPLDGATAALRAEVAALKAELAEARAARSGVAYVLRNPAIKTEARTAIAATSILEHRTSLEPSDDGFYRVSLDAVAEQAGCSPKRASVHLDRLHELGAIQKKVEWSARDVVNTDTGEIIREGVKYMYLRTDRPQSRTLQLLAAIETDPQRPTHGGRRIACPDHPDAGTVKRWTLHCQECDRLLDRGDEHRRAHQTETETETRSVKMTVGSEEHGHGDPYCHSVLSSIESAAGTATETRTPKLTVRVEPPTTCYSSLGCLQSAYCAAHGGCPYNPTPPTVLPSYTARKELRL